jgi:hypothetical protein
MSVCDLPNVLTAYDTYEAGGLLRILNVTTYLPTNPAHPRYDSENLHDLIGQLGPLSAELGYERALLHPFERPEA